MINSDPIVGFHRHVLPREFCHLSVVVLGESLLMGRSCCRGGELMSRGW
jgi:hypothetical protein